MSVTSRFALALQGTPRREDGTRACPRAPRARRAPTLPRKRVPRVPGRGAPPQGLDRGSERSRGGQERFYSGSRPGRPPPQRTRTAARAVEALSGRASSVVVRLARPTTAGQPPASASKPELIPSRASARSSSTSSSLIASMRLADLEHIAVQDAARRNPARPVAASRSGPAPAIAGRSPRRTPRQSPTH